MTKWWEDRVQVVSLLSNFIKVPRRIHEEGTFGKYSSSYISRACAAWGHYSRINDYKIMYKWSLCLSKPLLLQKGTGNLEGLLHKVSDVVSEVGYWCRWLCSDEGLNKHSW